MGADGCGSYPQGTTFTNTFVEAGEGLRKLIPLNPEQCLVHCHLCDCSMTLADGWCLSFDDDRHFICLECAKQAAILYTQAIKGQPDKRIGP